MSITMDKLVEAYVARRDKLTAMEKEHKAKTAALEAEMQKLETAMHRLLNELGVMAVRTSHGTPYKQTWTSVKVTDWEEVLDYIRQHDRYDLLEHRVNKTAVLDTKEPIPGVAIQQGIKVNVRRS